MSALQELWFEVAAYRWMVAVVGKVMEVDLKGFDGVERHDVNGPALHADDLKARDEAIDRLIQHHVVRRQEKVEANGLVEYLRPGGGSLAAWLLANPPVEFEVKKGY